MAVVHLPRGGAKMYSRMSGGLRGRVEVYVPPKSGELDWMDMFNFMRVT